MSFCVKYLCTMMRNTRHSQFIRRKKLFWLTALEVPTWLHCLGIYGEVALYDREKPFTSLLRNKKRRDEVQLSSLGTSPSHLKSKDTHTPGPTSLHVSLPRLQCPGDQPLTPGASEEHIQTWRPLEKPFGLLRGSQQSKT